MLLIPTSQTILIQKCSLTCPADGTQRTDFQCSDVTSFVQPPYCSQISIRKTNYSAATLWCPLPAGALHTHYVIKLYNNPVMKKLLPPYFTVKRNETQRWVRNFLIAPYCCGIQHRIRPEGSVHFLIMLLLLLVVLGNECIYKPVSSNNSSPRMQRPHSLTLACMATIAQ